MKFYNISIYGHKVNVLFNGDIYVFHNTYGGLVCIATRDFLKSNHFEVITGNRHFVGGSLTESRLKNAVTRFITKCETKYIDNEITFNYVSRDLADDYITIDYHERN